VVLAAIAVPLLLVAVFWLARLLFYGVLALHTRWRERVVRRRMREEKRKLRLAERVNALHAKVGETRSTLQAMAKETQDVAEELEEYLRERLEFLDSLSLEVQQKEQLSKLTPEMVVAFERALHTHFGNQRRSGLRSQIIFLVLAFFLGFVVNWLSSPTLAAMDRWLGR
jgi:hypothetical protein